MKVKEIMTHDVKTCAADAPLSVAAQIMWDNDCGIVPVVADDGRAVGVITDRDVCIACWSRDTRPSEIRVADCMSQPVKTCDTDETIETAEEIMRSGQVRRLPVTDADGRLVGIVSLNDMARAAERARAAKRKGIPSSRFVETLAAICRRRPVDRHTPVQFAG